MKILITGVAGFVGSTLARSLLECKEYAITGIDNFSYGYRERIGDFRDKIRFIEGDIANIATLMPDTKFDVIVHCAAIAPLAECQIDSRRALVQNVANCGSIADFALAAGTKNIIFFSSGAVYEGTKLFPTPETAAIVTRLVYPTTKYLAEEYFRSITRSHGLNVVSLRLFNLYGPHQDYFRKQPPLIGYLLRNALENTLATLYSSGEQQRDYIYIDDLIALVKLLFALLRDQKPGENYRVMNVGSGQAISVNQIIALIEQVVGKTIAIKRQLANDYWKNYPLLSQRAINLNPGIIEEEVNKYSCADMRYGSALVNWSPKVDMASGLKHCYNYARSIFGRA